jgi:molecular chaperone DnaK
MTTTIGIDLGTTKCTLSILENGKPVVIVNDDGHRTTPSYVAIKKDGEQLVGILARNQTAKNPFGTLFGVKRLIGRRFDDKEVAKMQKSAPYEIVAGPNGDAYVKIQDKTMSPQQVAGLLLAKLKKSAETYLGAKVTDAVITVPAYFNDSQREATRQAGQIAGLNVKRIINEPTAAAMAYGLDKKREGKIAVFDFGGGTFDISILDVMVTEEGNVIETIATNGDTFLGGENIDEVLTEYLVTQLKKENPDVDIDLHDPASKRQNAGVIQRIREAAEKAKIELSSVNSTNVSVPFLMDGVDLDVTLTRAKFEELAGPIIERTIAPCKQSLLDAGLKISDIDEVVLVGQSTRIPLVQTLVKDFFQKEPRKDVALDEIVAMGAAVQGGIFDNKIDNIVLVDVIPLTIGIRLSGGVMDPVIAANSKIPCKITEVYSNAEENQPNVGIMLYQGERPQAEDNKFLGKLTLELPTSDLNPVKKGQAQIEVTFDIDENGTLSVGAKDLKTGKAANATFKANGGLSDAEVEAMRKDAEKNAEADRAFKEARETEYVAGDEIEKAGKSLKDPNFTAAPEDLQKEFASALKELVAAKEKKDTSGMKVAMEGLNTSREKFKAYFSSLASNDNAGTTAQPAASTGTEGPSPETPGL